jgi:hypothetical protein
MEIMNKRSMLWLQCICNESITKLVMNVTY